MDFVDALLEPIGIILVAGEQAQPDERGAGFGFVGGESGEIVAFERALEPHGKRVPLLFRGKRILLFNLRWRELVEERFAELEKFVGCRVGRCIFRRGRLGGEREGDE